MPLGADLRYVGGGGHLPSGLCLLLFAFQLMAGPRQNLCREHGQAFRTDAGVPSRRARVERRLFAAIFDGKRHSMLRHRTMRKRCTGLPGERHRNAH